MNCLCSRWVGNTLLTVPGISDSPEVPPGAEQLPKSPSSQCAPLVCFSSVVTDMVQTPDGNGLGLDRSRPLGGPEGGLAAGSCCSVCPVLEMELVEGFCFLLGCAEFQ